MRKVIYIMILGVLTCLMGCQHKGDLNIEELRLLMSSNPDSVYFILQKSEEDTKHCDDFLAELEANNFYLDRDIPLDAMPQSIDEWMDMAAESEAGGWLTEQEFLDHASRWSHM